MDGAELILDSRVSQPELLELIRQLRGELASVSARLDQADCENRELRREIAQLKCDLGYWKAAHSTAVKKIAERDLRIEELQAEVKQLKSQRFGRKTEKSAAGTPDGSNDLPGLEQTPLGPPRRRGRQPGQAAPRRRRYDHLPVVEEFIDLPSSECVCGKCGAPRVPHGTEDSEQIEITVKAYRRRIRRRRYHRTCQCTTESRTMTAPLPAKVIPKGVLGNSVFVEVLIAKYQVHQPVERWLLQWRQNGLDLPKGTLFDGLRRMATLLAPVHDAILARAAAAEYSQADETRYFMFIETEDKHSHVWWMWAFVSADAIGFRLDPRRSHDVPQNHFAPESQAVIMVDRFSAYKAMSQVKCGNILLAFCWVHVRRDFVDIGKGYQELIPWAVEWLVHIRDLYRLQRQRLKHFHANETEQSASVNAQLRQHLSDMQNQAACELAEERTLREPCRKVLKSLQEHWTGLTRFVDDLRIPLDNNRTERAQRGVALGRKNYYGSHATWSGDLAEQMFSIFATLDLNGLNARLWLNWYLSDCHGGQPPPDISAYMPWNLSADRRAALLLRPETTD